MSLVIYTDGACEPNPGQGGWGFVAYSNGQEIYTEHGGEIVATNNTMEMTAMIRALEWLRDEIGVFEAKLLSDSQYVVKGCNDWRHGWKRKGWKRGKHALANVELWQRLDTLLVTMNVKIEWVKGHAGILGNERADELSQVGRASLTSHVIPDELRSQLAYVAA